MASTNHSALLMGVDYWNNWRRDNPGDCVDLSGTDFQAGRCRDVLQSSGGYDAQSKSVVYQFAQINFSNTDLSRSNLSKSRFFECDFRDAILSEADLSNARFVGCVFSESFRSEELNRFSDLAACWLDGTYANGTVFERCKMDGVDLALMKCDEKTRFEQVSAIGAKISRRVLDDMRDGGGFSVGQLRRMFIVDDVGALRRSFTGVRGLIQNLAVVLFAIPYAWFLANQWMLARVGESTAAERPSSPIILNLMKFIVSGGETWREWHLKWFPFLLFLFALAYNGIRLALSIKTVDLVHTRAVQGFDPDFRLAGRWRQLVLWHDRLSKVAVIVVLMHTVWFLFGRVPL